MLNDLFIASANAQEVATQGAEFSLASFVPIILIFIIFYFLIIRPQSKKIKEHQEMVNNLKIGNKVITSSGIFGVVKEIDKEGNAEIEIAENVIIKILKAHIAEVLNKETKEKKEVKKTKSK